MGLPEQGNENIFFLKRGKGTMTNYYENQYREEINSYPKTSREDFLSWVTENYDRAKSFVESLRKNNLYYTAVDYCIPIILVKWFRLMFIRG